MIVLKGCVCHHPAEHHCIAQRMKGSQLQYWAWGEGWADLDASYSEPGTTTYDETWCEPEAEWGITQGSE